ncbi:hypothetical protein ACFLV4_03115 [Chloroflexota bacterium]
MDEYEQIQRLRELRTRSIETWGRIFIPLGAGIIALFVSQLDKFVNRGWGFVFLFTGWMLLLICMAYWRWVVHHIDEQIVGMYPRMLELEREGGIETQTIYHFNNLHRHGRQELARTLGVEYAHLEVLTYRQVRERVAPLDDMQDILLNVWDQLGHRSLTSRGHVGQDWAVAIILFVLLAVIIGGHYCGGWF